MQSLICRTLQTRLLNYNGFGAIALTLNAQYEVGKLTIGRQEDRKIGRLEGSPSSLAIVLNRFCIVTKIRLCVISDTIRFSEVGIKVNRCLTVFNRADIVVYFQLSSGSFTIDVGSKVCIF